MGFRELTFAPESVFLVTGGAGFIGSNLCEAILDMGYTVRCLDNLSTGHYENIEPFLANPRFTFLKEDIRDLDSCLHATEGVDFVLNEAAWGSVPRSIEMPLLYEEINIRGTLNMMEAARQNGVKKFVYASSSSVYGDSTVLPVRVSGEPVKYFSAGIQDLIDRCHQFRDLQGDLRMFLLFFFFLFSDDLFCHINTCSYSIL